MATIFAAVEPPYPMIWRDWRKGRVVPFLGAGASLVGRPMGGTWNPEKPEFLPSGLDLSRWLAAETSFPANDEREKEDLAKVCSYLVAMGGRRKLREYLRDILNRTYQPGPLHQLLADVPAPQVIVVTNYDTLVEQAFLVAQKPFDLVIHPADRPDFANAVLWWPHGAAEPLPRDPAKLDGDIDLSKTTVIYKMHGTVWPPTPKWDNFVITEEDYVEFLSRMTTSTAIPTLFHPHFHECSFLFLGYSLRDWNLRVVLRNLSKHLASRGTSQDDQGDEVPCSWSIQRGPSELERQLWMKRHVNIFDADLNDFAARMRLEQQRTGG